MGALRREAGALSALNVDPRLQHWRRVLPTALASGHLAHRPFVVQRMFPGISANRVIASGDEATRVLTAAAASIGELHRCTASPSTVDAAALERWVDSPAYVVRQLAATFAGRKAGDAATNRLAAELHQALEGRTVPVGWMHGDFAPGNILVSADGVSVLGIVDWELAGSAELPPIDVVALLLTTRAQQRRRELGYVVRECLNGRPWTEFEQELLDSACSQLPGTQIDSRTLVLLWWLRYVAGNLTKSTRYARSRLWAWWNVRVVLDAFGLK
jgi:aminoglycoside phosphotransferase (APT) family kinase protein